MDIIFKYLGIDTEKVEYKTSFSSGADLISQVYYKLNHGETTVIPTGLYVDDFTICDDDKYVPEVQVRPRSSISKQGILTHIGTIDVDYRGEVGVILTNLSNIPFEIYKGSRIAQIVCGVSYRSPSINIKQNKRNGGFGST